MSGHSFLSSQWDGAATGIYRERDKDAQKHPIMTNKTSQSREYFKPMSMVPKVRVCTTLPFLSAAGVTGKGSLISKGKLNCHIFLFTQRMPKFSMTMLVA